MHESVDPHNVFGAVHGMATTELMQLMDGLFHNVEDGLFEVAYANEDPEYQRKTVELMRELRFRRDALLQNFSKRMSAAGQFWLRDLSVEEIQCEEQGWAAEIASKCTSHFGNVLQTIAERNGHATERVVARTAIPLSPEQVSFHFLMSCRNIESDPTCMATVYDLFGRFVLDRLGAVYGRINGQLEEAGYCTTAQLREMEELESYRA